MNPTNTYLDQYILSADPVQLIRMLYQKAIALVQDARRYLSGGEIAKRSTAITKAYDILLELLASLRDEVAPDLCGQLRSLYLYMQQRLLDANMKQEDAPLNEVLQLLTTLGEAWVAPAQTKAPVETSGDAANFSNGASRPSGKGYMIPSETLRTTAAHAYAA